MVIRPHVLYAALVPKELFNLFHVLNSLISLYFAPLVLNIINCGLFNPHPPLSIDFLTEIIGHIKMTMIRPP